MDASLSFNLLKVNKNFKFSLDTVRKFIEGIPSTKNPIAKG